MASNAPMGDLPTGVGNVVAVKVGSRVFNLMVGPNDDAYNLLKQLGISATLGFSSATRRDQDGLVATPAATQFVLRKLIDNCPAHPAVGIADPLLKVPQLEIVDLNHPSFDLSTLVRL